MNIDARNVENNLKHFRESPNRILKLVNFVREKYRR